jgi:hypothetical protein
MPDGLDAGAQKDVITNLAEGFVTNPARLYQPDLDAPYSVKLKLIEASPPDSPAYSLDVWFIAHGDVQALAKAVPGQVFAVYPPRAEVTPLGEEELKARNITISLKELPVWERYAHTRCVLLDEIEVRMTTRSVGSLTEASLVIASQIDPAFAGDQKHPNLWRRVKPSRGQGEPQSLGVHASYLKITRLAEPKDALFVELHQVITEPKTWFDGTALLRAKVPLWAQEEVRKFRQAARKTVPAP